MQTVGRMVFFLKSPRNNCFIPIFLYNDFNFCHFILYIRVHVNRNPVEMVEHVFRCMRMTATLVSVQN